MQIQTVFRAGNSDVVAIPKKALKKMGIKTGKKVAVSYSDHSITFFTKAPKETKHELIDDKEFVDLIKDVESRYGNALKELAHLS